MVRAYDLTHVRMSFNFCKAKVALFWWWVFAQISDIYMCVIYTCNYPKMYNFSKLESVLFCTFFLSIKYRVTFSEKGSYCYFIFEDMQIGVKKILRVHKVDLCFWDKFNKSTFSRWKTTDDERCHFWSHIRPRIKIVVFSLTILTLDHRIFSKILFKRLLRHIFGVDTCNYFVGNLYHSIFIYKLHLLWKNIPSC